MNRYDRQNSSAERLAIGLGWFSIGLGLAEVAAPNFVARLIGAPPNDQTRMVLRSYGTREISNGIAILTQPGDAKWLWSRVGGDAVDLATLARVLGSDNASRGRAIFAAASVLGVTALDVMAATQLGAQTDSDLTSYRPGRAVVVRHTVTVNRSIEEVYGFWRNFSNFPRFMAHIESVTVAGKRSHWVAKAPAGMKVEWDADVVEEAENERIAWRSLQGSDVQHSGSVRFVRAPGARGTEVRVELIYTPPAGAVGRAIAKLFGEEPEQQVRDDLRRFKQIVETGEIPLSDAPGLWRPAQPPERPEEVKRLAGVHP
jgi:uncharacterized membrane protein